MKTNIAFDVMEKILPDVAELMNDDDVKLDSEDFRKDGAKVGDMMTKLMPVFISRHRSAFFNIIAAISGKTAEEVAEQDFAETLKAFTEGFTDDMFVFFVLCLRLARRA